MAQLLKYSSLSLKYLEIQGSWAFKGGTVYIWDTVLNIEYVCDFMSHNTPDFFKTYRANPPLMAARLNLGTIMKVAPNDAFDWLLQITPPSIMGMRPFLFGLA